MNWKQPKVYAVKHKDEATRVASRSGGIFTALSDQVLSNGGVVYGCVLTDKFDAVHIRADNEKDRNRMRGSKYIQSKLGDTFKSVKADLDAQNSVLFSGTSCQVAGLKKYLGKETDKFDAVHIRADNEKDRNRMRGSKYIQSKLGDTFKSVKADLDAQNSVLFSGTSCQVAGLKKYLGKEYDNLFCVDIVCHGVPSKKVWNAYLRWQKQKNHSEIASVDFRNKKDFGWHDHVETLYFENGKSMSSRVFKELFYGHTVLRPSCYECPYKSVIHPGDITIADYWGIEKAAPEFDDNKGVSLVLVNNEAGEKAFEKVKEGLIWKQTKLEDSMQPPLKSPFPKPDNRERFWSDFENKSFEYVAKKYGGIGFKNDAKSFMRKIKRKIKKLVVKGGKSNTSTI